LDSQSLVQVLFKILVVLILVSINGFFVAAEFSLVKIRASRLTQLVNEGNQQARFVQNITLKLDAYLSACQLGITLASLGLGWAGEPAVATIIVPVLSLFNVSEATVHTIAFSIAFALITTLHIVLGELAPKSVAIQKTEKTALWLSLPLVIFYRTTYPAIWVLNHLSNLILKIIGLEPATENESAHTEEEIRILVTESHKSGLIDKTESVLFDKVFEFSDRLARQAMIPRTSAVILDVDDSYEDNLELILNTRHTRYPVAEGDKDNIIGFIHVTDFYAETLKAGNKDLKSFVRKILNVAESMELSHVLRLMQKSRILIAIVVDEFGGTAGILTLEDVLEEIVGEIQDEFDNEKPLIEKVENGYSVYGRLLIEDLNDLLLTDISNEEVDTVGGWVHMLLEDVPEVGKSITFEQYSFEITEMERNRISRVLIKKNEIEENLKDKI
jgi:CBS domain containing-hemolysin-like protein